MRYRLLGRSGLRVSELFLGAMTFGEDWGWGAARDECRRMLDAYAEAGGNVIDTAVTYTNGASERILGELLGTDRDHFVVSTKYTITTDPTDPNASGNHRKNLLQSLERSLKSLQTDRIDLYWVHIWDPKTPIEETMRALDDAVRAGKILYVGISDAPAWVVSRANTVAEWRGWSAAAAIQVPYSLLQRDVERDLLPMAKYLGLSVAARVHSPAACCRESSTTAHIPNPPGCQPTRSARGTVALPVWFKKWPTTEAVGVADCHRVDDGPPSRDPPHRGCPPPQPVGGQPRQRRAHSRCRRAGSTRRGQCHHIGFSSRLHPRVQWLRLRLGREARGRCITDQTLSVNGGLHEGAGRPQG